MLFVIPTTAPFVNYIHVRLPVFARRSRAQLLRWAQSIPPNTEVDMTTMRSYGRPRVTRMPLEDLQKRTLGFGVANLVKLQRPYQSKAKRPWWMGKEPTQFYVGSARGKSREASVWQIIWDKIPNP